MTLLVKGGRVVNPAVNQDEICDILVENGKIKAIGKNLPADGAEVYDASGLVVAPGFIDMHVHLRQLLPVVSPALLRCRIRIRSLIKPSS